MAERRMDRERLAASIGKLSDHEVGEILEYVTVLESMRHETSAASPADDELITTLSNSRESRRARTVVEWDRVRRRAERFALPGLSRGVSV